MRLRVTYGKQTHEGDFSSLEELRAAIHSLTGLPTARQKLLFRSTAARNDTELAALLGAVSAAAASGAAAAPRLMVFEQPAEASLAASQPLRAQRADGQQQRAPLVPPEALAEMPDHIVEAVCAWLPAEDISRLSRTCRRMAQACGSERLWLAAYERNFAVRAPAERMRTARAVALFSSARGLPLPPPLPANLPQDVLWATERERQLNAQIRAPSSLGGAVWKRMFLRRRAAEAHMWSGPLCERRTVTNTCVSSAYDAMGCELAVGTEDGVLVLSLAGAPKAQLKTSLVGVGAPQEVLAFCSPVLVSADADSSEATLWDLSTPSCALPWNKTSPEKKAVFQVGRSKQSAVTHMCLARDDLNTLIAGKQDAVSAVDLGTLKTLWEKQLEKPVTAMCSHGNMPHTIFVASEKSVSVIDLRAPSTPRMLPFAENITCMCCNDNDPSSFFVGTQDGYIREWDAVKENVIPISQRELNLPCSLYHSSKYLAAASSNMLTLWAENYEQSLMRIPTGGAHSVYLGDTFLLSASAFVQIFDFSRESRFWQ